MAISKVIVLDPHGEETFNEHLTTADREIAIDEHNSDAQAHPAIQEKLADKIDDIKVDNDSVVVTEDGKRVVNFRKDQFGKVDNVLVNGESVLNENNEAEIDVPTTVEELEDGADYAKKSELQEVEDSLQEQIDEVVVYDIDASVDDGVGNPQVVKTKENNIIHLAFKNLKGVKGDKMTFSDLSPEEREALRGPEGQSAIFDPQTETVSVMEQGIGSSTTNMMSQKAITEEITIEGDVVDLSGLEVQNCWIDNNNEWAVAQIAGNIQCVFLPVQPGQIFRITANNENNSYVAFLTSDSHDTGDTPYFVNGVSERTIISSGNWLIAKAPSDAVYLYILTKLGGNSGYAPYEVRRMKSFNQSHYEILQKTSQQVDALQEADVELGNEIVRKTAYVVEMDTVYNPNNGYTLLDAVISSQNYGGNWAVYPNNRYKSTCIPVTGGTTIIFKASEEKGIYYAFLKSLPTDPINGKTPEWAKGYTQRRIVTANTEERLEAPEDARFFVFISTVESEPRTPQRIAYLSDVKDATTRLTERIDAMQGQSVVPNVIEYHTASVRRNPLPTDIDSDPTANHEIVSTEVPSGWAVMWPTSYSKEGKPTQVVAMLHGASAYVNEEIMGYPSGTNKTRWDGWRNRYLQEGYAVIDINGLGESVEDDDNSKHYGCPTAIETLDKAFEYLKEHYNVADKLLIHGTSMGGALAQSYTLTYPEKVIAVALYAPVCLMVSAAVRATTRIANLWQYESYQAARADKYAKLVGYAPFARCLAWKNNELIEMTWETIGSWPETGKAEDVNEGYERFTLYKPIEKFPVPVRCWHGTNDTNVDISSSQFVIEGYRRGGSQASLRICNGQTHDICTGHVNYVINEGIDFFKRYL